MVFWDLFYLVEAISSRGNVSLALENRLELISARHTALYM